MSFESFLIEKFGEHEPKEIDELVLDDLIANMGNLSEEHKKTLERYSNLIRLSMNNLGITSLTNFPSIVNLHVLEISLNCLTGEDFDKIPKLYPNLHKLKVTGNKIESIDVFKAISKTKIERIETIENPFMEKNKNGLLALKITLSGSIGIDVATIPMVVTAAASVPTSSVLM